MSFKQRVVGASVNQISDSLINIETCQLPPAEEKHHQHHLDNYCSPYPGYVPSSHHASQVRNSSSSPDGEENVNDQNSADSEAEDKSMSLMSTSNNYK